tara:strand:- start:9 stop:605 length:597 start_codon:yes stop_codon:yes gene_type:complete
MKELSPYILKKISNNLDHFFNLATNKQIRDGQSWYKNANLEANKIAKKYNLDVLKVSGVISALSPRNKWKRNLIDADAVCNAYKNNIGPSFIKVCTFNNNKLKSFGILAGSVKITDKSLKTYNFVNNIAYLDNDFLTVDIWHLRACFNNMININSASIGKKAYKQIKDLTIKKAKKIGLTGFEFQAIIWLSAQKNINK